MRLAMSALFFLLLVCAGLNNAELYLGDGVPSSLVRGVRQGGWGPRGYYGNRRGPVDIQRTTVNISPYGRETIRTTNVLRPGRR